MTSYQLSPSLDWLLTCIQDSHEYLRVWSNSYQVVFFSSFFWMQPLRAISLRICTILHTTFLIHSYWLFEVYKIIIVLVIPFRFFSTTLEYSSNIHYSTSFPFVASSYPSWSVLPFIWVITSSSVYLKNLQLKRISESKILSLHRMVVSLHNPPGLSSSRCRSTYIRDIQKCCINFVPVFIKEPFSFPHFSL